MLQLEWVFAIARLLFVVTMTTAARSYQFIQMPDVIQLLSYTANNSIAATSATDCVPLITANTVALLYSPTNSRCYAYSKISGFNTRNTNGDVYYLKMVGMCGNCATSKQAKAAILNYVYGDTACPDTFFTYDSSTGYCVGPISSQVPGNSNQYFSNYGSSYLQGAYRNGSLLTMSRGLASKALSIACPFANSSTAMFDSVWYCYTQFGPLTAPSTTYITQNVCGSWISGGMPIKFIHQAEPGYISIRNGAFTYLGMYLPTGSAVAAANYRYYDGTRIPAAYSRWVSGRPVGSPLVYIGTSLTLSDYSTARMNRLMCRNVA